MSSRKRTAELQQQAKIAAKNRVYIWQSPQWPRLRCDMAALAPAIAQVRSLQAQLMGRLTALNLSTQSETQFIHWVQEAQSTAHIEGEPLQLHSVRASVARRLHLTLSPKHQDAGTEGMVDILQNALTIAQNHGALDHGALHAWHAALFPTGRSGITSIVTGQYRNHPQAMQIVTPSAHGDGNDVVHYQAPASAAVPDQMAALLAWFDASQPSSTAWPTCGVVRAALVHLWFEAIHPFEDGNGRLGRAVTELALFQDWQHQFQGETPLRVYSLSQQFWLDRQGYYAQLQAATGHDAMDVTPWVAWFLNCVAQAMQASLAQMRLALAKTHFWQDVMHAAPQLSPAQRKVLNQLYDTPDGFKNGLNTALYASIASCSRVTAYRDLADLLARGILKQWGVGRGTRYGLQTPPFAI